MKKKQSNLDFDDSKFLRVSKNKKVLSRNKLINSKPRVNFDDSGRDTNQIVLEGEEEYKFNKRIPFMDEDIFDYFGKSKGKNKEGLGKIDDVTLYLKNEVKLISNRDQNAS